MFKGLATAGFILAFATGCAGQGSSPTVPALTTQNSNQTDATLQTARAAPLDSTQAASVAYSDTFEQDAVNTSAKGWTTLLGSFGVCQPSGKTHLDCETNSGIAEAVPTVSGSAAWTDYQVDADVIRGSNTSQVALLARMSDANHFYSFNIASSAGSTRQIWQIWKYDGKWTELSGRTFPNTVGQSTHVRLVLAGATMTAYAGPAASLVRLGSVTDPSFKSGSIGIRTDSATSSSFDNITVTLASGSTSPTPTPAPTASASSGGVATYDGCQIFTPGDYFNADITNASVDPHSANYLSSLTAVDNTGFQPALGIEPVNAASNSTPLYTVKPKVAWHTFPVKYPWASGFQIEDASDAHYIAINSQTCHLYEAYGTSFSNGVFSAYSGKDYDLKQPFKIGGGVMASGLSLFAGAVRHQEIATGIHHALNVDIWQNALCNCFTAPAAASDGVSYNGPSSAYEMPYGAHLRLKASYNCSGWGAQSGAICTALKHYGLFISDTDGHYTNNNKLFFVNPSDGGSWNGGDLSAMSALRFSDFDVLKLGTIQH